MTDEGYDDSAEGYPEPDETGDDIEDILNPEVEEPYPFDTGADEAPDTPPE